ncbi:hypothetical protein [Glaciibacter superstes]|uniref:hypothetical protein n=1 Tax=Glaciibacter superstes TaxID=501023 RepID=UPI0003B56736|nr:hypothetical protein [Glaciibacter superstes]
MPDFDAPFPDAVDAYAALRRLAHETRTITTPAQMYPMLGELLGTVRALRQVLDQLATANVNHRAYALDDNGNHLAGAHSALAAADELAQAVTALDQVHDRLDQASGHSSRIAWRTAPQPHTPENVQASMPERRWVNVVFLQGDAADEILDLIAKDGTDAAINDLAGCDYGDETTQAALENGYVYDDVPVGALDKVATQGAYTLTYSPFLGHVSLNREHPPAPVGGPMAMAAGGAVARQHGILPVQAKKQDWFTRPPGASSPRSGRELAL